MENRHQLKIDKMFTLLLILCYAENKHDMQIVQTTYFTTYFKLVIVF